MRLGLNLGYSGSSLGIDLTMVQEADRLGYHSVWSAEAYGSDAVTPITWVAAHTTRIKVGTAIMQIPARTPTLTATTALTLDQLSGGRFLLGLGVSGPQVVEGWHGVAFGKPLARTREYVEIVRAVWRREKALEFTGTYYQIPYAGADATGLGKPLRSILHGRDDIPSISPPSAPRTWPSPPRSPTGGCPCSSRPSACRCGRSRSSRASALPAAASRSPGSTSRRPCPW
jgi:F420-dependent oxidoreductase-like protein